MGCPEWEEARFSTSSMNFDGPLTGQRSSWAVFGDQNGLLRALSGTCLDYLIAFREGASTAKGLWESSFQEEARSPNFTKGSGIFSNHKSQDAIEKIVVRISALFKFGFLNERMSFRLFETASSFLRCSC